MRTGRGAQAGIAAVLGALVLLGARGEARAAGEAGAVSASEDAPTAPGAGMDASAVSEANSKAPAGEQRVADGPALRGALRTVGRFHMLRYESSDEIDKSGTDESLDILQYATLRAIHLGDPRISAVVSARAQWDALRPGVSSELLDLSDAEPLSRHVKLLEAYGEARDLGDHVTLRAGRQSVDAFEPILLDGGRVDVDDAWIFRGSAWGGMRASLYSGSDDRALVGAQVGARPLPWIDVLLGWFHYIADSYCAEANASPLEDLHLRGKVEGIGGKLSEATLEARGRLAEPGLELRLGYTRWFENQRFPYDYTFEHDPGKDDSRLLIGARTDGNDWSAEAIFDHVPHLVLSARGRVFRPIGPQDDPYNLPCVEVSPGVELYDVPWSGLEVDLRTIHYRADAGPPAGIDPATVQGFTDLRGEGISRYDSLAFDVSQRFGRRVRAEAGTFLRRQTYENRFGSLSGEKAWDVHIESRWLVTDGLTLGIRYDVARDFDLVAPHIGMDQRVALEVRYEF